MKKTKLSLCMISCLLAVSGLSGCKNKVKSSSDGVLLTYYVDGVKHEIKADDILNEYYDDSSKYQAIYDQIYSVIVRNYFAKERTPGEAYTGGPKVPLGLSQMVEINRDAKLKVEDDKATAKANAKANKTRYKKEFNAILEEKGVKTEKELLQKYVEELQKETFENNFYTYSLEEIKSGNKGNSISVDTVDGVEKFKWNGYINDKLPYHVSHVMVGFSGSSDTSYYNDTITATDAKNLANMVASLEDPNKSFARVAADSADQGSGEKQGDLGIMDFDTSFVNEFKIGVYAYESLYKEASGISSDDIINMTGTSYKTLIESTFGLALGELPTVNSSVFGDLKTYAETEKASDGNKVIGGSSLVLPRNIIYNKYINNHSIFFIRDEESTSEKYRELKGKKVLHAQIGTDQDGNKIWEPVIAVRASSASNGELHFIVVNRSPFDGVDKTVAKAERVVNGVKLSEYYTTFSPREAGYPKYDNGKNKTTYVNSLNNDESQNRDRANEFASKLKSYDSDKIGKYMFLKYMNEEEITFGENSALAEALMKWINASVQQSKDTSEENWKKTVNEYIEKLTKQKAEREKLIPEFGVALFENANSNKTIYECLYDANPTKDLYEPNKSALVDFIIKTNKVTVERDGDGNPTAQTIADAHAYLGHLEGAETSSVSAEPVCNWYKVKGGLFNDGETHND